MPQPRPPEEMPVPGFSGTGALTIAPETQFAELVQHVMQGYLLALDAMLERRHANLQLGLTDQLTQMQSSLLSELQANINDQITVSFKTAVSSQKLTDRLSDSRPTRDEGCAEERPDSTDAFDDVDDMPTKTESRFSLRSDESEPPPPPPPESWRRKVHWLIHHTRFEMAVAGLVILNMLMMFLQMEHEGHQKAARLGLEAAGTYESVQSFFGTIDHFFNAIFVSELVLRIVGDGLAVFKQIANVFDAVIVFCTCVDMYLLSVVLGSKSGAANLKFARVARVFKVFKMLRAFRAAAFFSELRILGKTVISSMMALLWSAILLSFIILCSGLFMAQMLEGCIDDTNQKYELRVWVFTHYGSGFRAAYTMFEATLSGGWPKYARPLVDDVNIGFAFFWMTYVMFVIFAVIRVITALFLKNTIKVSQGDEEMMFMEKMKEKEVYVAKIRNFLKQADKDGNGQMDRDELDAAIKNPAITKYFRAIGLQLHEIDGLFNILDDGDGLISSEEFIGGCMRMTGNARAVDSVLIMHEQTAMHKKLDEIDMKLGKR